MFFKQSSINSRWNTRSNSGKNKNSSFFGEKSNQLRYNEIQDEQTLISQQEFEKYYNATKEFYNAILSYLESSESEEADFNDLIDIINMEQHTENREEFEHFFHTVNHISTNHQRDDFFFKKVFRILNNYENEIKQTFSNFEIFNIFKNNRILLLFLLENSFITFDEKIYLYFTEKDKTENNKFCHFFYPEIKEFIGEEKSKDIEKILLSNDQNIFYNFDEKRHKGENDSYISSLIRQDLVEDFISHVNRSSISLTSKIEPSIFETNQFLIDNNPTLIEYSAFYGSIQIFKFLQMNKVNLTDSLWLYTIHSKNAELIHLLEYNDVKPPNYYYSTCFDESIKCHHNDFADYIETNLLEQRIEELKSNEKIFSDILYYHNYAYITQSFMSNDDFFYYLCKYKYYKFVNLFMKLNEKVLKKFDNLDSQKKANLNSFIVYYLLEKQTNVSFNNCDSLKNIVFPPSLTSNNANVF